MIEVWQLFRKGLTLFSRRGRLVLWLYGTTLVVLSGLDAAALFLLANVFNTSMISGASEIVVDTSAQDLALILILFTLRSLLSTLITWFMTIQISKEEGRISVLEFEKLLNPKTILSSPHSSEFFNSVDRGPRYLITVLTSSATILCEFILGIAIFTALLLIQPLTSVLAVGYFVLVAVIQHRGLSKISTQLGEDSVRLTSSVYELLGDASNLRRVLSDENRESLVEALRTKRSDLAKNQGMVSFVATIPRYFLEIVFAIGLALIGGVTYLISGPPEAFAATTLFVAAGFRLLPIVNRVQALFLLLLTATPVAKLALKQFATLPNITYGHPQSPKNIYELNEVSFTYHDASDPVLTNISIDLQFGKQYAIVGPSGVGKTTLVDIFLGLNAPQSGTIKRQQNLKLAYVPQDTFIAAVSLAQNVALSWNINSVDTEKVFKVLLQAQLAEFVNRVYDQTPLDPSALSGGQKQRIGLARALYAGANFLVLDEITSALDMETEQQIYETINALRGNATVVIVAHRLSTVQRADTVFYLDDGTVAGSGTFAELSASLPSFRRQIEFSKIDMVR
jgi:ABC-type multidrug transport system fused ATPase/permease subunit